MSKTNITMPQFSVVTIPFSPLIIYYYHPKTGASWHILNLNRKRRCTCPELVYLIFLCINGF